MAYYNRYAALALQTEIGFFPDIKLEAKSTDKFEIYQMGKSRMDKLSESFYGEAWWGFLILMANPELPGLEYLIPNETPIRIPFPLEATVKELKDKIEEKKRYYGG
jgi:hypothetical protein